MDGDINLLIDITRKASRFLARDYLELENLQSSSKNTESFCKKSILKAIDNLTSGFSKYYKHIVFSNEDAKSLHYDGPVILVEALDGIRNLQRALPFFGMMITVLLKKDNEWNAEKCIINFPALNQIYYTQKGRGTWLDNHSSNLSGLTRARVSGINKLDDVTISTKPELLKITDNISDNVRCFDSYLYSAALLCSGKVDVCVVPKRSLSNRGIELMIVEAGGRCVVTADLIIGCNYPLFEEIRQLIN